MPNWVHMNNYHAHAIGAALEELNKRLDVLDKRLERIEGLLSVKE